MKKNFFGVIDIIYMTIDFYFPYNTIKLVCTTSFLPPKKFFKHVTEKKVSKKALNELIIVFFLSVCGVKRNRSIVNHLSGCNVQHLS